MYDISSIENEMLSFWKRIDLLSLLTKKNKTGKGYFLLDGPPYANFVPHVGHVRNTVYKDVQLRLAFMKGYNVLFQPGFDTHGLPIENMVERQIKIHSKKDIESYGVVRFLEACKTLATTSKDAWVSVYSSLGSWYSWKEPYLTYDRTYIESAWWAFSELWKKGLVYEGQKPVHWCPQCETALAGYEVTDSYTSMRDPSLYVAFRLAGEDSSLLVYTTTPWTLVSNVGIAINPDEEYSLVLTPNGKLILASSRLFLLEDLSLSYKVLERFQGSSLAGKRYLPLLPVPQQEELSLNPRAHKVYLSVPLLKERIASKTAAKKGLETKDVFEHFVSVQDGTGLVHLAPGHGKSDYELGRAYNLPYPSPVDEKGIFTSLAGMFDGFFVKDANKEIVSLLERQHSVVFSGHINHSYPVCWRCKSPLLFRMSQQWFFKIPRKKMLAETQKVLWLPSFAKEKFEHWVVNAEDWAFSRQRYWGIPIPLWRCSSCGHYEIISSFRNLQQKSPKQLDSSFDLHNASLVSFPCRCNGEMNRISDIFDVWYDSSIAPFAAIGYPFKNKNLFNSHFPTSRINESQDQVRGWFYYLMFTNVSIFSKNPYKTVSMPGWVVDKHGDKMSKSVGNVIWAKEGISTLGADALRLYYLWDIAPYELCRFNPDTIKQEVWRRLNVIWNVHIYILSRLPTLVSSKRVVAIEDRWILSRLQSTITTYEKAMTSFEYHIAGRQLIDFLVNDLSRSYIQLVRERVDQGDRATLSVIYRSLFSGLCLLAPICPFISDKIYQNFRLKYNLTDASIHLQTPPKYSSTLHNLELEQQMNLVQELVQRGLSERAQLRLGARWPILSVTITSPLGDSLKPFTPIILRQLNVKEVIFLKGEDNLVFESHLTPELEAEGFSRELMRRIQDLRKKHGLSSSDLITIWVNSPINISSFSEEIQKRVGANKLIFGDVRGAYRHSFIIRERCFSFGFDTI